MEELLHRGARRRLRRQQRRIGPPLRQPVFGQQPAHGVRLAALVRVRVRVRVRDRVRVRVRVRVRERP